MVPCNHHHSSCDVQQVIEGEDKHSTSSRTYSYYSQRPPADVRLLCHVGNYHQNDPDSLISSDSLIGPGSSLISPDHLIGPGPSLIRNDTRSVTPQTSSTSDEDSPWHKRDLVRPYCSDLNVSSDPPRAKTRPISYDVRGEYLSKEDFRAKYGRYYNTKPSSTIKDRKFYCRHLQGGSNVYYYTDQGQINDSERTAFIQPISAYWSDTESRKRSAPTSFNNLTPLTTFGRGENPHSLLTERNEIRDVMPGQTQPFTGQSMPTLQQEKVLTENGGRRKSSAVSFHLQTLVIGNDGGVEYFDSSPPVFDENGDDDRETEALMEPKTEFEKLTVVNTEFNSNRRNFNDVQKEESNPSSTDQAANHRSIAAPFRDPSHQSIAASFKDPSSAHPSFTDRSTTQPSRNVPASTQPERCGIPQPFLTRPSSHHICDRIEIDATNPLLQSPAVTERVSKLVTDPFSDTSSSGTIRSDSRESTPIYAAPVKKLEGKMGKPEVPHPPAGRRPRNVNPELEEKLQRMARDLDSSRIVPEEKPKVPSSSSLAFDCTVPNSKAVSRLKKSFSAYVVQASPAAINSSSSDLMTSSMHSTLGNGSGDELETVMGRNFPHQRCLSVDVAAPFGKERSSGDNKDSRQSRSRFSSIRKFLRINEPASSSLNSVRRLDRDSSSTNCSTISCSSNGSNSFNGGIAGSLRKFPLFSGRKSRASLKGLFHGTNECHAIGEIAQDTDVIVTEITELPSANNTLVRASRNYGQFGLAPGQSNIDLGASVASRLGMITDEHRKAECRATESQRGQGDGKMATTNSPTNGPENRNRAEMPPRPAPLPVISSNAPASSIPSASSNSSFLSSHSSSAPSNAPKIRRPAPKPPPTPLRSERTETRNGNLDKPVFAQEEVKEVEPETGHRKMIDADKAPHMPSKLTSPTTTSTPIGSPQSLPVSDDRYDQLVSDHLSTLSHLMEHFPSTARQCKRKLTNLGMDPTKLLWSDFVITTTSQLATETLVLYQAALKLEHNKMEGQSLKVNLVITPLRYSNPFPTPTSHHLSFFLPAVAEFQDRLPSRLVTKSVQGNDSSSDSSPRMGDDRGTEQLILCKIQVLPRLQAFSIESYADHTSFRHRPHKQPYLHEQESCFIMIQFISALKYLQSKGVEEITSDLDGFLLLRTPSSRYSQLALCCEAFSDTASTSTKLRINLCQGALATLCQLLHTEIPTEELIQDGQVPSFTALTAYSRGFQKVAAILHQERPHSLTQAKSILEFMFWVNQYNDQGTTFQMEQPARWWLDKERARFICHALKALLYLLGDGSKENDGSPQNSQGNRLDILDEYHAQFLLHATAKSLVEAVNVLDDHCTGDILL